MSVLPRMTAPERREAILDAARRLFADRGFRGVTTRELAAEVGVTEPILYQHFPSKRDLYTALIESRIEQTREFKERFHALCSEPGSAEDFLHQLGLLIVDWHESDPSFMRLLLFSSLEGHGLKEMFHERMATNYFRSLVDTFSLIIEREDFRAVDPKLAAYTFSAMIGHHCMERLIFCHLMGDTPNETVIKTMVDIFLNGLKREKQ